MVGRAAVRGEVVDVGLVGRVLGLEMDFKIELEVRVVVGAVQDGTAETAGDGVAGAGRLDHVGAEDEGRDGILEGEEVPGGTGGGEFLGEGGGHCVYYGRRRMRERDNETEYDFGFDVI